jgi:5-methylcytosine-specific restriction endonuclease McrA
MPTRTSTPKPRCSKGSASQGAASPDCSKNNPMLPRLMVQKLKGADSTRWDRISRHYRNAHPLCEWCLKEGRVVPAHAVDHIAPHRGNKTLLYDMNNLQSLCELCHNARKQSLETYGYDRTIGKDGWPIDPAHPANNRNGGVPTLQGFSIPHFVRKSRIPVHLVCGPPASGKTTFVKQHMQPGDIVIDLDDYKERHGSRYATDHRITSAAFAERDSAIRALADTPSGQAWLIVSAPSIEERSAWKRALGNVTVHMMTTSKDECHKRIDQDKSRAHAAHSLHGAVENFFSKKT